MHLSIKKLQDTQKLGSWLKRIVYTTLMDYYRKGKKQPGLTYDLENREIEQDNPEGNLALISCIQSLLQLLPAQQRGLLEAVEVQGISQAKYARDHKLPLSTVKSRVQRAKGKIKDQITSNCFLRTDSYGNVTDYRLPEKT
jgi:RNA polymerase sigma-70 factor (ECF subfamily)